MKHFYYSAKEANYLQELALKSPLKIPVLIGIDAIHGNALVSIFVSKRARVMSF